jgi:DNA-binding transcriptional regulator/RsmH inhibitor MraZ
MVLPQSDNNLEKSYCFGFYDGTISEGKRLGLSRGIIQQLREHQVNSLWRFFGATGSFLILCPPEHRNLYLAETTAIMTTAGHLDRKFLYSGSEAKIDSQGRIALTEYFIEYAKLKVGDPIRIVGAGLWYEIWPYGQLQKIIYLRNDPRNGLPP